MKFTIRDALLITVIVAVALGWWLDRTRLARRTPPTPPREELYQLIDTRNHREDFYLFNPRTGEMWHRYSDGKWSSFAASVEESK